MLSVLFTEIQDQIARKSRSDSEDMQKFESMAKCEHPYHPNTNACIFEGGPHHFPKAHALRYELRKFGNDRMYIRGEWALRRWHRSSFWGTGWGAKVIS